MKPTASTRALAQALRGLFALTRAEQLVAEGVSDVRLPRPPEVAGRWATHNRAWAACPEATAVYRATVEAWRAEMGRCPLNGARLPCSCDLPTAADSEVA